MIFQYTFLFGVSVLEIKSSTQFPKKVSEELAMLIETLQTELNPKIINSSAYRLNTSQVGMPAFVKPEFINYLKFCLKIKESPGTELFKLNQKEEDDSNEDAPLYTISNKDSAVIRHKDVKFNSNLLSRYYIVEKINDLLEEVGDFNYLITTNLIQCSKGKLRWNTNFFIPELDDYVHFKLHNQYSILETIPKDNKTRKTNTKFASMDKIIIPKYIIITGNDIFKAKFLGLELGNTTSKYDFETIAKKENVSLTVISDANEVVNF